MSQPEKPNETNCRDGMRYSVDCWYGGYGPGVIVVEHVETAPLMPRNWSTVKWTYWGRDNSQTGGNSGMAAFLNNLNGPEVNARVHWGVNA